MVKKILILSVLGFSSVMAADGAKLYGAKCAECHGTDGKEASIAGKAIAGGSGALAKLIGYKNGTFGGDQKALMQGNVATISDSDLQSIASYVDTLK
ncbi:MAG: c-type cytochrome [Sulfuricurvum sp.]|uniref:c-type cytochrome n=1 Tax=Sulfuricurvum sp. TaxID=2025608 RepID=UPI0025D56B32|nr:c-type cytochrome [Sulfuricurvum sp.]MBV5322127.1 c-type cytochrome [Sulfuricurvum sp.]